MQHQGHFTVTLEHLIGIQLDTRIEGSAAHGQLCLLLQYSGAGVV